MRVRLTILTLVFTVLGAALADEASANLSGGSRLMYYFTQTSFDPGQPAGSAITVFSVTNNAESSVDVRFTIRNGANCTAAGPFTQTVASGETKILNVASFALPASFPAGVIDLWAVNGAGVPIRWDLLTGKSLVVDLGSGLVAAAAVPAAKMFSDDRTDVDGNVIADNAATDTHAPVAITTDFFPQGGVFSDRIVLMSPAETPGAAPAPATGGSAFILNHYTNAGVATDFPAATTCVYSSSLIAALGVGPATAGGRVEAVNFLVGKGIIGWKFSKIQVGTVSVLLAELLPSWASGNLNSSNQ